MANLEIIARLKNLMSGEATKIKEDMKGIAQATGEADVKTATLTTHQQALSTEMSKVAAAVGANKAAVEGAGQTYQNLETALSKVEAVAPQVADSLEDMAKGAAKAEEDLKGVTQATGDADVKAAAFAARQRLLASEMNKLAKEVAANKMSVEEANKKYQEFEKTLVKVETVAPQVANSLDDIDQSAGKSHLSFTELNQALELVEKGFNAVMTVGREVYEVIGEGAKITAAQNTFEHLSESINTTAEALNTSMRQATAGMVADAELMVGANRFVAMGLANTQDEAADLANIAAQLGVAFRGDAVAGMEELALMLANQSIPRLDSFGVSAGKVRERINELMATEQGMTRETAFMTAFMEQAGETMGKIGPQGETAAAGLARVEAGIKNMGDEFKASVAEEFAPIMTKLADEVLPKLAEVTTNNVVPAVQEMVGLFGDIANDGGDAEQKISDLGDAFDVLAGAIRTIRGIRDNLSDTSRVMRLVMQDGGQIKELLGIGFTFAGNAVEYFSNILQGNGRGALAAYNAQARELYDLFGGLPIVGSLFDKVIQQTTQSLTTGTHGTKEHAEAVVAETQAIVELNEVQSIRNKLTLDVARAEKDAAASTYASSAAYGEFQDKIAQTNAQLSENEAMIAAANAATAAKAEQDYAAAEAEEAAAEATRKHTEAVAAFAAQTGKAFMEAATAGDSLGYFNENLEELGTQMVAVTTGAAANSADFELLQDAYDKAAVKLDKYRLGIEGANLSEEERAEKIAQLSEQMGSYQAQMDALGGSVTTYSERTVTATINQAAVNQALVESIAAAGGSAEQIGAAALALGTMSAAQVEAAMKAAELEIRIAGVRQAYLDGTLTADQLSGAIAQQVEIVNGMTTQMNDASGAINLVGESERTTTQSTQAMIDKFGEVPDEVTTEFVITGDYAGATQAFLDKLNSIPREVDVNVNVHGGGANTNYGAGGYQPMSSGGRVEPFKSYLVGDAPGGGITPYTEMFIPDSPGFIVNNETLQRLMGSNQMGTPVAFGGGGQTSYSDSATIQIVNNFFGAVDQSSVGRLENSQRGIIEQALAERDKRLSAQSRMRS